MVEKKVKITFFTEILDVLFFCSNCNSRQLIPWTSSWPRGLCRSTRLSFSLLFCFSYEICTFPKLVFIVKVENRWTLRFNNIRRRGTRRLNQQRNLEWVSFFFSHRILNKISGFWGLAKNSGVQTETHLVFVSLEHEHWTNEVQQTQCASTNMNAHQLFLWELCIVSHYQ